MKRQNEVAKHIRRGKQKRKEKREKKKNRKKEKGESWKVGGGKAGMNE